jgi:outer membrane protein assembly factor BamD (BamD/ComL family)
VTEQKEHTEHDPVVKTVEWIKKHQRKLSVVAAAVVVVVAGTFYFKSAKQRRENFANTLLTTARTEAAAGNVALAVADLSDLALSHRGTLAAEEAELLLAQLRLNEGQAEAAKQSLQEYVDRGPSSQFRAPAYGLLGVANEQTLNLPEAASAYIAAAEHAWYDFLKAQYLLDAARVYTQNGDTAQAVTTYKRILDELPDTDMVAEARLRLGELERTGVDHG